jgi:protein O-GlcNAc transferase
MPNPQHELQRARTALTGGQVTAAVRVCQKLLTENPRNVDARYLHGRSLAALGRWREAASEFRRVLSDRNGFFPAMVDLGIAETLGGNQHDARLILEQARAIDSRPAELHFGLGLCSLGSNDYLGAASAFQSAIERNPGFPVAHNNLGVAYDRLGRLPEAVACFRQAASLYPGYADAHRNLGDALLRLGENAGAIAAFQRAAELQPSDGTAFAELGAAQLTAGDFASAVKSLERALTFDSRLSGAAVNLGEALCRLNQADRAAVAFRQAMGVDPHCAEALMGLGKLAMASGDEDAAARHFVAAAGARPTDSKIALAAASGLEDLGRAAEALPILRTAARSQAADADIHDALGGLLHRLDQLPEALDCYERALALDERRPGTLLNCGHALESMGALSRAIACFRQALKIRPSDAQSVASIASCGYRLCDWDLVDEMLAALRELPQGIDELQAFLMLATDLEPAEVAQSLKRRVRKTADAVPRHAAPALLQGAKESLRVAYVSPDYRVHPVAYAIAGVIARHDRERIAPIAVSLAAGDGSAIESRLRAGFDEFIDASSLSNRDIVKLMQERAIDVAIDLAGLTAGARTEIFAMRAAPVQINYLGFPGSMGMDFMDFIIADRLVIREADEVHYPERVLRMPNCYLPFDDTRLITDAGTDRQAAGLPSEGFIFCAFNNGFKITRELFNVWMSLLHDVPGSILWLRSMGPQTAANLKDAALSLGVSANRLVFAKFEEQIDAHLARLQLADLFLDTVPYNAHTTATEALWAGVPVITYGGKSFAGRVGASVLTACGMMDLICADLAGYRELALKIARSPSLHTELCDRLRQTKPSAPLFDTSRYTRDLENLIFEAHRLRGAGIATGPRH